MADVTTLLQEHHSTVRKQIAELEDIDALNALYDAEREDKGRESILSAIIERLEVLGAESDEPEATAAEDAPEPEVVDLDGVDLDEVVAAAPAHPVSLVRDGDGYKAEAGVGIEIVSVKEHPTQEWVKVVYEADGGLRAAYFDRHTLALLPN